MYLNKRFEDFTNLMERLNFEKIPRKSFLSDFLQYTTMKRKRGPEKNMQKARGPTRGNLFDKFIRRHSVAFRCMGSN